MIEAIDSAPALSQDAGPVPSDRAEVRGWAKPKYEPYKHFFEGGRALCRMWNLPDEQAVDPTTPGPEEQLCGYCKRNAPTAHLFRGGDADAGDVGLRAPVEGSPLPTIEQGL